MHPEDLRLLREIRDAKNGQKVFGQRQGQSYDEFEVEVLRLLELDDEALITMQPKPKRSSQGDGRYLKTGVCRLTLKGREALARFSD